VGEQPLPFSLSTEYRVRIIKLQNQQDFMYFVLQLQSVQSIMILLKNQKKNGHITYRAILSNDLDISYETEKEELGLNQFESVLTNAGFKILQGEGCIQEYGRRSDD
jgi:hypothetical protein